MSREVLTLTDRAAVAATVAAQLRAYLHELQKDPHKIVQLCLTGGRVANDVYGQLAAAGPGEVDWGRVEFWWGDERFLPAGDPDRNAGQSLGLLAGGLPVDRARVHPMPAASTNGECNFINATQHYAEELSDTTFDLCLLGVGEDGHVASLFPGHPSFEPTTTRKVVGVLEAPKPPPARLSLTLPVINASTQVWLIVAGTDKAEATARALSGDDSLPAGAVAARERTVWFLDEEAAAGLI